MKCKKVALIFQGTVKNDSRVRREVESISKFSEIDVFSSEVNSDDWSFFNDKVKLIPFKLENSWINRNFYFHRMYSSVKQLINPENYDCLICIDYPTLKVGVELKSIHPHLKLIYDSHEIYIETINQFFPKTGIKTIYGIPLTIVNKIYHSRLERKLVKSVDVCVTVCESLKQHFKQQWNKDSHVLRNCPDIAQLDKLEHGTNPYIEQYGCKPDEKILLYQGDINPGRGLAQTVNLMTRLPRSYKLFIIGSGMLKDELAQRATSLNLPNIYFIDRLPYDELFRYTRYAHLGISLIEPINLSKKLSLPNKLFEYMYCGVPFLSSDLPEPNNLLKVADVGYICKDFTIETIAGTVEQIFADQQLYKTKCEKAKKTIIESLNWETEFKSLLNEIK